MTPRQLDKYSQGEWAAAVSNAPFPDPVYLFSLSIKGFQLALGKDRWEYNHAIRIVGGTVIEMLAEGRVELPLREWARQRKRKVALFQPLRPFAEVAPAKYGTFDILQIGLHHIRERLGIGNGWDGRDGVPKTWEGNFCSEEVAKALGRGDGHRILPCQLFELPELRYEETLHTR